MEFGDDDIGVHSFIACLYCENFDFNGQTDLAVFVGSAPIDQKSAKSSETKLVGHADQVSGLIRFRDFIVGPAYILISV